MKILHCVIPVLFLFIISFSNAGVIEDYGLNNIKEMANNKDTINSEAWYIWGMAYYTGYKELKLDHYKAFKRIKKSAEYGNSKAQFQLAKMYYAGHGTNVSIELAKKWFLIAQENGYKEAGLILNHIAKDEQLAKFDWVYDKETLTNKGWYQLILAATEHNDTIAQKQLAKMHYSGYGAEKDIEKAKWWFQKASDLGDEEAKQILIMINAHKTYRHYSWMDKDTSGYDSSWQQSSGLVIRKRVFADSNDNYYASNFDFIDYYYEKPRVDLINYLRKPIKPKDYNYGFLADLGSLSSSRGKSSGLLYRFITKKQPQNYVVKGKAVRKEKISGILDYFDTEESIKPQDKKLGLLDFVGTSEPVAKTKAKEHGLLYELMFDKKYTNLAKLFLSIKKTIKESKDKYSAIFEPFLDEKPTKYTETKKVVRKEKISGLLDYLDVQKDERPRGKKLGILDFPATSVPSVKKVKDKSPGLLDGFITSDSNNLLDAIDNLDDHKTKPKEKDGLLDPIVDIEWPSFEKSDTDDTDNLLGSLDLFDFMSYETDDNTLFDGLTIFDAKEEQVQYDVEPQEDKTVLFDIFTKQKKPEKDLTDTVTEEENLVDISIFGDIVEQQEEQALETGTKNEGTGLLDIFKTKKDAKEPDNLFDVVGSLGSPLREKDDEKVGLLDKVFDTYSSIARYDVEKVEKVEKVKEVESEAVTIETKVKEKERTGLLDGLFGPGEENVNVVEEGLKPSIFDKLFDFDSEEEVPDSSDNDENKPEKTESTAIKVEVKEKERTGLLDGLFGPGEENVNVVEEGLKPSIFDKLFDFDSEEEVPDSSDNDENKPEEKTESTAIKVEVKEKERTGLLDGLFGPGEENVNVVEEEPDILYKLFNFDSDDSEDAEENGGILDDIFNP